MGRAVAAPVGQEFPSAGAETERLSLVALLHEILATGWIAAEEGREMILAVRSLAFGDVLTGERGEAGKEIHLAHERIRCAGLHFFRPTND